MMATVRCILAVVAGRGWLVHQMDVNNAFLHGDSDEEIYMVLAHGISYEENKVCKLKKVFIWLEVGFQTMVC